MLPAYYLGLVNIRSPEQTADGLIGLLKYETSREMRQQFLTRFALERHLGCLAAALHSIETSDQPFSLRPAPAVG